LLNRPAPTPANAADGAGESLTSGSSNAGFGAYALRKVTTGYENVGFAPYALTSLVSGYGNIGIGKEAGNTTISGNLGIYIGFQSGFYETGSSKFYVQAGRGTSIATDIAKSLLYGELDNQNFGIAGGTFGTSAKGVLSQKTNTKPTTSPADVVQSGSTDMAGAGTATWYLRDEQGTFSYIGKTTSFPNQVGIGTTTPRAGYGFDSYSAPVIIGSTTVTPGLIASGATYVGTIAITGLLPNAFVQLAKSDTAVEVNLTGIATTGFVFFTITNLAATDQTFGEITVRAKAINKP